MGSDQSTQLTSMCTVARSSCAPSEPSRSSTSRTWQRTMQEAALWACIQVSGSSEGYLFMYAWAARETSPASGFDRCHKRLADVPWVSAAERTFSPHMLFDAPSTAKLTARRVEVRLAEELELGACCAG
jgi:hypothetical protein